MSVLLELAIFPTDKGESVSPYVAKVIEMIRNSGHPYKLTPMATVMETDTMAEALTLIQKAHDILEPESERIYSVAKFDIRKKGTNRMEQKVNSIQREIGSVNT